MIHTMLHGRKIANIFWGIAFVTLFSKMVACSAKLENAPTAGIYTGEMGMVQLVLDNDSTYVISLRQGSTIRKEVGTWRTEDDFLLLYGGYPLDNIVSTNYSDGNSDSLRIVIEDASVFGTGNDIKLRIKDSIQFAFNNTNELIINKLDLISKIYKSVPAEDFPKISAMFINDIIVQNNINYLVLFNFDASAVVRITKKGQYQAPEKEVSFKMRVGERSLTCYQCGFGSSADTLILSIK